MQSAEWIWRWCTISIFKDLLCRFNKCFLKFSCFVSHLLLLDCCILSKQQNKNGALFYIIYRSSADLLSKYQDHDRPSANFKRCEMSDSCALSERLLCTWHFLRAGLMFIIGKAQSCSQLMVNSSSFTDYLQLTRVRLCKWSSPLSFLGGNTKSPPDRTISHCKASSAPLIFLFCCAHIFFTHLCSLPFISSPALTLTFCLWLYLWVIFILLNSCLQLFLDYFPISKCSLHACGGLKAALVSWIFCNNNWRLLLFFVSPCWMVKSVVLDPAPVFHTDPRWGWGQVVVLPSDHQRRENRRAESPPSASGRRHRAVSVFLLAEGSDASVRHRLKAVSRLVHL